jgi:hypothetical protein
MPKRPTDFSKTKMYRIVCKDLTVPFGYVGGSVDLIKRRNRHKNDCINPTNKAHNFYIYKKIREHGGWENWDLIKIEDFPCKSKEESVIRERALYETMFEHKLNTIRPHITAEERIQNHNTCGIVKYTCVCGSIICQKSKPRHERTIKHQTYITNNPVV